MNKIPLCRAYTDEAEESAMLQALRSGWLAHGPFNEKFEDKFKALLGVKHAITLNSCTSALFLALKGHDIRGEVILPSFTFVATANAVVTAGATPVFADVEGITCMLDPGAVEAKITPRTEALIVVHYAGQPAAMDAFAALARKHNLLLIEDSAETLNATFDGRQAGTFGIGCFSFFPTKNITTGEGGMLTTGDDGFAARCRALIGHGIDKDTHRRVKDAAPWFRDAILPGYNFRMSNVLAALGNAQMDKLGDITRLRRQHAVRLGEALAPLERAGKIRLPSVHPRATHTYQMYTVQTVDPARRDPLLRDLIDQGIGASVHWQPVVHEQSFYARLLADLPPYCSRDLDESKRLAARILTLPMFPGLTDAEIDSVASAVARHFA